jgi:hypothetical protein
LNFGKAKKPANFIAGLPSFQQKPIPEDIEEGYSDQYPNPPPDSNLP